MKKTFYDHYVEGCRLRGRDPGPLVPSRETSRDTPRPPTQQLPRDYKREFARLMRKATHNAGAVVDVISDNPAQQALANELWAKQRGIL